MAVCLGLVGGGVVGVAITAGRLTIGPLAIAHGNQYLSRILRTDPQAYSVDSQRRLYPLRMRHPGAWRNLQLKLGFTYLGIQSKRRNAHGQPGTVFLHLYVFLWLEILQGQADFC